MVDTERGDGDADCHVRPAGPFDGPAIATVHAAAIRANGPRAYDDREVDAWAGAVDPEGYPLERGRSGAQFLVAERSGDVVGFGCLEPNRGEITSVFVHPDFGGNGIGTALVEALEARASEVGLGRLTVVAAKNAVPFYESVGYEPIGETAHAFDGVELACVEMERDLE